MVYRHNKCGGLIDLKTRTCQRCNRHWNIIFFYLSPSSIRPAPGDYEPKVKKTNDSITTRKKYADWADGVKGAKLIPSLLPNWPRWARILSVSILLIVVGGLLMYWGFYG